MTSRMDRFTVSFELKRELSDLELKEALDVGVDVATPHHGFPGAEAGVEVVVGQDHRGVLLGESGTRAHCERDGSSLEGLDVIDSIADDSDLLDRANRLT